MYLPAKVKIIILYIIASAVLISCKNVSKITSDAVSLETVNSVRNYEYADDLGHHLIFKNSVPRGGRYTDPNGREYSRLLFWTQITNETAGPLDLKLNFPTDSIEVPAMPGKFFKVLVPPDTLTAAKELLNDYGISDLKSFLDNNVHKPSTLKRTIHPKEKSGFYVILLFDTEVPGPTRTGLYLWGRDLYYKVTRYKGKHGGTFADEVKIKCGSINLKNLTLHK